MPGELKLLRRESSREARGGAGGADGGTGNSLGGGVSLG